MAPQAEDHDHLLVRAKLVHQPVRPGDPARIGPGQIADQLFKRWRGGKRVLFNQVQKLFSLVPKPCPGELAGIFLSSFGVDKPPQGPVSPSLAFLPVQIMALSYRRESGQPDPARH